MNSSNEIGGFFELELPSAGRMPHDQAIRLNSGRSCLRYLIRAHGIKTIHLPYFTCPVVWESVKAEGCQIEFYSIDANFNPTKTFPGTDFILYTNYFGICSQNVADLARKYPNLIVDNAQAFYMPPAGFASFYSPRKFFGVPDGGLLYSSTAITPDFPQGQSYHRCSHLLKRLDLSAQAAYADFQMNDESIGHEPIQSMSKLTARLLQSIDCESARKRRLANFASLHARLGDRNALSIQLREKDVPMTYPFSCKDKTLRQRLIQQKIFVPQYWPGMEAYAPTDSLELTLRQQIVPLPCDQRYSETEMKNICASVNR
jgi:hypothetical protein